MAQNRVFVSPGVYTSEKDLTYVTRQVGVTTLGLAGETVKGPAFQPIFVSNYNEFTSFFGGLNAKKFKDTGAPQYELPYIAKSYLSKSNQLFVTRVLGFSGYDAGKAWAITLDAALDESTLETVSTSAYTNNLITFTATTGGSLTVVSANANIQTLINDGKLTAELAFLATSPTGTTTDVETKYIKNVNNNTFTGVEFDLTITAVGASGGNITGTTSGTVVTYSGTGYEGVDNKVVALLRSRGKYDGNENLNFEIQSIGSLIIDPSADEAEENPLGTLNLSGASTTQGAFVYDISFDRTKRNYITKVLGREAQDGKTAVFVEEIFENMFNDLVTAEKVRGIKLELTEYLNEFTDYKYEYSPAVTPYVVSEVRGNKILKLFRLWTISDGNNANKEVKISIVNIKPDAREFDLYIRAYNDTDANPVILERYSRCTMDPNSNNYIARMIGTLDGYYQSRSNYVLVEMDEDENTSDAFPAGFMGVPVRNYQGDSNTNTLAPNIEYKKAYIPFENKRKVFLGLSNSVGIDQDFFDYKGEQFSATTSGFHLDINAAAITSIHNEPVTFETGTAPFQNESGLANTDYEKVFARKFTFAPYGGFDGWDVYRTNRTNQDTYANNTSGKALSGITNGNFVERALTNGDLGNSSDYYAYLESIRTFANPESTNINVFATPGIDVSNNSNLVEATIEMVETERADSLYITTLPDTDGAGQVISAEEAVNLLDDSGIDSNYTATYWPWIQVNDTENNVLIYLPPTRDVVRNIALTDNIAFPWFAVAGTRRGDVDAIKARKKLTIDERDTLYEGRINPIATFTSEGIKIWGNKTLQVRESALNRINVRRLLLQARKLVAAVSIRLLFEQNDDIVRNQFLTLVNPILDNIRSERGITDFRIELDRSPESIDRNELNGKIFIKPTRALEFITVEFNIMPTGASFDDI